jgi:hypothetical protein
MSGTCRDTYYNYGSYLRTRGTDKAVCELNNKIIANTAAIAKNTSDIATNTSNIATNTLDISTNTLDISTNTFNIAANTLDISTNTFNITAISNTISNYDISFTTIDLSATNLDISNNVNFTKNPIVTNDVSYNNRALQIYSESTTILDISAIGQYSATLHDLSLNLPTVYTDLDPNVLSGSNPVFTNDYIDFSNNQLYFKDSLMEIYVSAKLSFDQVQTKSISFVFDNITATSEIILDTRSINEIGVEKTLCFGPHMFVLKDYTPPQAPTDISFIEDQWRVGIDICGGNPTGTVTFSENPRMIIKQKSIV